MVYPKNRIVIIVLLTLSMFDSSYARTFLTRTVLTTTPSRRNEKHSLLDIRGGASKAARKKSSIARTATGKKKVGEKEMEKKPTNSLLQLLQHYNRILPLTRIYITMVVVVTLIGAAIGEENAQVILSLDPMRVMHGFEVWRPITAACFLGPMSISWILNGYYLFQYGSSLERTFGRAQYLIFLLTNMVILTIFSILAGQPFFTSSMITAMLHVLSRATPKVKVKWLLMTVPYYTLPYGLMAADILQAKTIAAAIPHIFGILSGHFYHFHKSIWPKMKGEDWLQAPDFLVNRLDPDAAKKEESKPLKQRKRQKGRKLSSK